MSKAILVAALLAGCGGTAASVPEDTDAQAVVTVDAGTQCPEGTKLNSCGLAGTCDAECLERNDIPTCLGPGNNIDATSTCVHEMIMVKDNGCCQ